MLDIVSRQSHYCKQSAVIRGAKLQSIQDKQSVHLVDLPLYPVVQNEGNYQSLGLWTENI